MKRWHLDGFVEEIALARLKSQSLTVDMAGLN
jgi:hypothetical protein